ncbi:MAG: biotin carboxylase N-terminal domain-containing protein [Candidatus Limnocylindrales bacterium]
MTDDLRPSEVARRLGTSTRTVQRWIERGELPATRVGGRWRVASDAFDALHRPPASINVIFIANRGEIVTRIARTCSRLGIAAIAAMVTGPDALDLLDAEAVVAAAVAGGADAVHPGFGFLAENAAFAERVAASDLRWIGPPPSAIRAMGDKAAARRLATSLGVPVPTGYDDADQSDAALAAAAERIGVPFLIKPAAGGGGKGMHTVRDIARLPMDLAAARREALAAFGDDRLILERLVEGARHVEIQVLFDAHGHGIHLGERDCSVQRRHQKVLEEAPSPAVDATLRARMGEAAVTLAAAVGYVGAGTCAFLRDDRGGCTILEMTTRLQFEPPVTEAITGGDLVADQIRIAAGEPLGVTQADVTATGHAVEVRLYAEDPEDGFLPATGRIERLHWPSGDGIRVDAGVVEGDVVGSRFDPMLAKIIARGDDRADALDRLARALDQTVVLGLTTNLRFLRWLVREPAVRDGQVRTDTLDRLWPPDDWASRVVIPERAWSAAAALLTGPGAGPWEGGWRLNGPASVRLTADGLARSVAPGDAAADGDKAAAVRIDGVVHVDVDGRSVAFSIAPPPDIDRAVRAAAQAHGGGPVDLVAPMPGQVIAIHAAAGDTVTAGDPIVTLEAMKMEHAASAPIDGRLADVLVSPGDQVVRGQILATVSG